MTTYSRSDLATRALRDLGVIAADETPSATDLDFAEETVSSVVDQLLTEGVMIRDGSDRIVPGSYLIQLAKRVALDLGPAFGMFSVMEAEMAKQAANLTLRRMNAKQPTGAVAEAEYF